MENSILDFIQHTFKDAQTINLEKVGQYLKADNLKVLINEDNYWHSFLKNKISQKESQFMFLNKKEKSLVGSFEDFKQSLNDCFRCQAISSEQPFTFIKQYNIHKFNSLADANEMLMSCRCLPNSMVTGLLMAKTNNECYILKHPINSDPEVKAYILNLSNHAVDMSQISLQDVYIYGENSVTLLGSDFKSVPNTYLIQLYLKTTQPGVSNDLIEVTNYNNNSSENKASLMIKAEKLTADSIIKCVQKLKGICFCVSSSRKVVALLSSSKNHVKIFELEAEEEDDEEMEENGNNDSNEDNTSEGNKTTEEQICDQRAESSVLNSGKHSKQHLGKQQQSSASSTCSIAPSFCSSTAATYNSTNTLESSVRAKRKKNFDEDEDDEYNSNNMDQLETEGINDQKCSNERRDTQE